MGTLLLECRKGEVPIDRLDIRRVPALSVDLRREFGMDVDDESGVMPPGSFVLSVCGPVPDADPIGEIRIVMAGREVSIVGALTGRTGVVEVTPDHVSATQWDGAYADTLRSYMEGVLQ